LTAAPKGNDVLIASSASGPLFILSGDEDLRLLRVAAYINQS